MTVHRLTLSLACALALAAPSSLADDRDACSEFLAADAVKEAAGIASDRHIEAVRSSPSLYYSPKTKAVQKAFGEASARHHEAAKFVQSKISDETTSRLLSALQKHWASTTSLQSRFHDWANEKNVLLSLDDPDGERFFWASIYIERYWSVLKKACDLGLVERGK